MVHSRYPKTLIIPKLSHYRLFATIILLSFFVISCKSFRNVTKVPERHVIKSEWEPEKSEVSFGVELGLESLKNELDKYSGTSYSESKPEIAEIVKAGVKTKNPFYDPVKWIKTKNPKYNPTKWWKSCGWLGCWKTKNPFYDPVKWIKTKNPKYNPKKFIILNIYYAQVSGYNIKSTIKGKIKVTAHGNDKLNFKIPIKISGDVTFGILPILAAAKTPFSGELVVDIDVQINSRTDWCFDIKSDFDFSWKKRLKLDYTYGLNLIELDVTSLANPEIEKLLSDIESDINNSIDCHKLKNIARTKWKTHVNQLSEDYWSIFVPNSAGLSHLKVTENKIGIYGVFRGDIKLQQDDQNIPQAGPLPDLIIIESAKPSVNLSIPVETKYAYIDDKLLESVKANPIELGNNDAGITGTVELLDLKTYPSGKDLGIKVKFKVKTNKSWLNLRATAYFSGEMSHQPPRPDLRDNPLPFAINDRHYIKYDIDKLAFRDFGNATDRLIITLAYEQLIKEIDKVPDIDVTDEIRSIEDQLSELINQLIIEIGQSSPEVPPVITVNGPEVRLKDWGYSEKELIFVLNAIVNYTYGK